MTKLTSNNADETVLAHSEPPSFWQRYQTPILLTLVGGAIDTIGFITLFGFFYRTRHW